MPEDELELRGGVEYPGEAQAQEMAAGLDGAPPTRSWMVGYATWAAFASLVEAFANRVHGVIGPSWQEVTAAAAASEASRRGPGPACMGLAVTCVN